MYLSLSSRPYRVSIAGEMRPIFDLYLGHHPDNINQGDVLLVGHRRLTVPISRSFARSRFCALAAPIERAHLPFQEQLFEDAIERKEKK